MLSLKSKIALALLLVVAYGLFVLAFALSLPSSLPNITAENGLQLLAKQPNQEAFVIKNFIDNQGVFPADSSLAIEEPDVLPDYASIQHFFSSHQRLHHALTQNTLSVIDDFGEQHSVIYQTRSLQDLTGLFWLQLLCGLAGMLVCLMVCIPAKKSTAIYAFGLTGLSYVLFSSAAAIYSTRDFFIAADNFALLSGLNHLGALLFSASLAVFLWNYPCKAPSVWLTRFFYFAFLFAIVLDQSQWLASPVEGFHLWVMGIFLLGLAGAIWQWRQTKKQPEQRTALYWILLAIIAGTIFFAGGMILPAIFKMAQPASQGLLFTTFLLMYVGMALVVVRYHLFDLDEWWFSLWAWLLGGLLVMLSDLLIISLLNLSSPVSLAISVALVGWLYLPLRQHFWNRLLPNHHQGLDEWLTHALPAMLDAQHQENSEAGLEEALNAVFRPLSLKKQIRISGEISLLDKGKSLYVPQATGQNAWILVHAQQGERLFNRHDIRTASWVLSLYQLTKQAQEAHDEGVRHERHRICCDMHDDLGAKLLQLLHRSPDNVKPLVREAMRDLRYLLTDLETGPLKLELAILRWREEIESRCQDSGIHLEWHSQPIDSLLNINTFSELTRILREAVSNALKHANTSVLNIAITNEDQQLKIVIINDGAISTKIVEDSRGLTIMRNRTQKLNGQCRYEIVGDCWQVTLEIPLVK